ncbi:MAG: sodium/proton-translocating pyrophosphatase, partial [Proteobacteria bacterium]|nr:sodium/proton-translocating pyrophosphatase [Pseudomonadota bacterium]
MSTQLLFVLACGVLALAYGLWASRSVLSADPGTERMQEIAAAIQEGAQAYLKRQYRAIAMVGVVVFLIVSFALDFTVGIGFLIGATLSGLTGFIGMNVSVRANVRTTQAARKGLAEGLAIAFRAGAVTGMLVAGLALLAVAGYYAVLLAMEFHGRELIEPLIGLGFGASLISIFARLGGGIFTKGADVGGDLVGKIEAGIPEDDPRNPATIADNVGDNVGDVAGMGADLFESYVGSIIASMTLAAFAYKEDPAMSGMVLLPLAVAALGIFASILGTFAVKTQDEHGLHGALFRGLIVASIAVIGATAWLTIGGGLTLPETLVGVTHDLGTGLALLISVVSGLIVGVIIGKITEYYTSTDRKP